MQRISRRKQTAAVGNLRVHQLYYSSRTVSTKGNVCICRHVSTWLLSCYLWNETR